MTDGPPGDLNPQISRRNLPPYIVRKRQRQAEENARDQRRHEEAINVHVAAHRAAIDTLAKQHQRSADELDFDLVGDTRAAAIWQMAGRSIGISRLILDALQLGYTTEVVHLGRALHEAVRLLDAFVASEDEGLIRKWLADAGNVWVRPKEARAAEVKFEEHLTEAMRAEGKQEIERTKDRVKALYEKLSEAAHHRRQWVQEAVAPELRTMIVGRTDIWLRRAVTTATLVAVVEESVISVGDALEQFTGPGWYEQAIKPHIATFDALRVARPIRT